MAQTEVRDPEEAYPGKDLGTLDFEATDEIVGKYFAGLEVDSGFYTSDSPYDKPIVPSMVLTNVDTGFSGSGFKNNFGTLWMRQEWDLMKPMFQGVTYKRSSKVADVYEWRNRTVVNQEVSLFSPEGELMALGHHHQSFMLNQSSGTVKLRDPKSKEGIRKFDVPQGEDIGSSSHLVTVEMCGEFFHGNKNYHTNKEAAESLGFTNVVVGGRMTMSYIGDLMDRHFGKGWFEGGKLDIKFTNIVWPDDEVIARGIITDRVQEDGNTRANVAVWMEKPDGTVVIVGTASALE